MIEVESEGFRAQLEQAMRDWRVPLGLLGWELKGESLQPRSLIFPKHQDNLPLKNVFDRLCETRVESVWEMFGNGTN